MEHFLGHYENDYEIGLTCQNAELKPVLDYLSSSKKIFFDQRRGLFKVDNNTTLQSYITNPPDPKVHYLNFTYKNLQFVISYNFPYKTINVYMGKIFSEEDLDLVCSQIPKITGYKVVKNTRTASFRYNAFRDKKDYSEIITNNILKFISNHPTDYMKFASLYISKSYNFGPRLNLPLQLEALHNNIGLFYLSSTFVYSPDKKYLIILRHFSPSPGLIVSLNADSILINIYDWSDTLIRVIEAPPFELHNISEISVSILEDKYDINFDECYDIILRSLTSFYFQSKPLNNNSPSSE